MKINTIRNQFSNLMALAAGLSLTFAIPTSADAAGYMKIGDIQGEATDSSHDKWIDVLSTDWGMHRPGGGLSGQSRRRASVIIEDLKFTKELDKSSPKLQESCLMGKVIPKVEIELTRTVGNREVVYLKIELKNVQVVGTRFHFQAGAAAGEEAVPVEDFSLNFEEIKVTYSELDEDGNSKGDVEYSWKVEEGEA